MMLCLCCGALFERPRAVEGGFSHAFGFRRELEYLCPCCGSDDLSPVLPCPACVGGYMAEGELLCPACRDRLRRRLCDFADALTAEEEAQVDAWLDGRSICERGRFA